VFKKYFFGKEEQAIWWCGAAAPPYSHSFFWKNGVFQHFPFCHRGGFANSGMDKSPEKRITPLSKGAGLGGG
jgi:hypothetical protein